MAEKIRVKVQDLNHKSSRVSTRYGEVRFNRDGIGVLMIEKTDANADWEKNLGILQWTPTEISADEVIEMDPEDLDGESRAQALRELKAHYEKMVELEKRLDVKMTALGLALDGGGAAAPAQQQAIDEQQSMLARAEAGLREKDEFLSRKEAELAAKQRELDELLAMARQDAGNAPTTKVETAKPDDVTKVESPDARTKQTGKSSK